MGPGDMIAAYHRDGHAFSILARHNFKTGKRAGQLEWAFPLAPNFDGYVQYFAGCGYALVDYNVFQRVLGLGVQVGF